MVTTGRIHHSGNIIRIDPEGRETVYEYDGLGRETALTDHEGDRSEVSYDLAGREIERRLANGVMTRREYDMDGNVTVMTNYGPSGQVRSAFVYACDAAGRRISQTEHGGAVTEYDYDEAGRLVEVRYPLRALSVLRDSQVRPIERVTRDTPVLAQHGALPAATSWWIPDRYLDATVAVAKSTVFLQDPLLGTRFDWIDVGKGGKSALGINDLEWPGKNKAIFRIDTPHRKTEYYHLNFKGPLKEMFGNHKQVSKQLYTAAQWARKNAQVVAKVGRGVATTVAVGVDAVRIHNAYVADEHTFGENTAARMGGCTGRWKDRGRHRDCAWYGYRTWSWHSYRRYRGRTSRWNRWFVGRVTIGRIVRTSPLCFTAGIHAE